MAGWAIVVEFGTGAMDPHVFGTWATEEAAQAQADAWTARVAHSFGYDDPNDMTDFAAQVVPVLPKAARAFQEAWRQQSGTELP